MCCKLLQTADCSCSMACHNMCWTALPCTHFCFHVLVLLPIIMAAPSEEGPGAGEEELRSSTNMCRRRCTHTQWVKWLWEGGASHCYVLWLTWGENLAGACQVQRISQNLWL